MKEIAFSIIIALALFSIVNRNLRSFRNNKGLCGKCGKELEQNGIVEVTFSNGTYKFCITCGNGIKKVDFWFYSISGLIVTAILAMGLYFDRL